MHASNYLATLRHDSAAIFTNQEKHLNVRQIGKRMICGKDENIHDHGSRSAWARSYQISVLTQNVTVIRPTLWRCRGKWNLAPRFLEDWKVCAVHFSRFPEHRAFDFHTKINAGLPKTIFHRCDFLRTNRIKFRLRTYSIFAWGSHGVSKRGSFFLLLQLEYSQKLSVCTGISRHFIEMFVWNGFSVYNFDAIR